VVAAAVATAALPDASVARASASAVRAASSTDRPVAGASAPPRALAPLPPLPLSAREAQDPTSQGDLPPGAFFFFSLSRQRVLRGHREEKVPAAHAAGTPRPAVPSAPAAGSSSPSSVPPALAPTTAPRARPLGLGAWAGQTTQHLRSPYAKNDCQNRAGTLRESKKGRKTYSPPGRRGA
jgi:hypothetical protein